MRADVGRGVLMITTAILFGCSDGDRTSVLDPVSNGGKTPGTSSVEASSQPFYGGVFLGEALSTPEKIESAIASHAQRVGKRPALVKTFHQISADMSASGWAGRVVHAVARTGSTNFIALDLDWPGRAGGSLLEAINNGSADAMLARTARGLAQISGPVLLEPGWEMNGNWDYKWQGVANGSSTAAPARYVDAWRRIVNIFRDNGATNVRWVFNPNTGNPMAAGAAPGSSHWNWYAHYYPGDAYVDYIGAHGYTGSAVWNTPYHSFGELFDGRDADYMLTDMMNRFPNKPIIIGEMAVEEISGKDKGAWISAAYQQMRANGRIVGAVWFDMNKEADWRIESSTSSLSAYRNAMTQPRVRDRYDDELVRASAVMLAGK